MSARALQRPGVCLFCALNPIKPAPRLLPRVQKAFRGKTSGGSSKREHTGPPNPPLRFTGRDNGRDNRFQLPGGGRFAQRGFEASVNEGLTLVRRETNDAEFLTSSMLSRRDYEREWEMFEDRVKRWIKRGTPEASVLKRDHDAGRRTLRNRIKHLFYAQLFGQRFTHAEKKNQEAVADLRYPQEWYPATRSMRRKVHMHVGPTNSGKTYHALKRLESAQRGIYLGPLRLLAHEVYTRLNAKGRPTALVTGEEQRMPEGAAEPEMWSCTVEMAPLNMPLDVAVIDEIQMISHVERGWAWTQAFMGLQADEIHLCGEARTVPLMKELCALCGDDIFVHEYERLTPLQVADTSLRGRLTDNLKKGDCVVSFSVLGIHALRRMIEKDTGRKCAIVYGSLPPETRAQQARLFNDPNNDYDYLVASDAIGMGLNLSIKRVIFETTMKNNGERLVPLQISEVKQIAGRAGRYRSAHEDNLEAEAEAEQNLVAADPVIDLDDGGPPVEEKASDEPDFSTRAPKDTKSVGVATCMEGFDMTHLRRCLAMEPEPITTAGLFPPALVVERFASYFPPGTPFSYILLRLHDICQTSKRFHICALKDTVVIADAIHSVKNLTIQERLVMCAAPTSLRDQKERELMMRMARCIADNESGNFLDLPIPLEHMDKPPSKERKYLADLELLHKMIVLYLWLSYRFPHVFTTRAVANHAKELVEEAIEKTLSEFSFTDTARLKAVEKRKEAMRKIEEERAQQSEQEAQQEELVNEMELELEDEKDVPEPVLDALKDRHVFDSEPKRDDIDEYPTPELEIEEATRRRRHAH